MDKATLARSTVHLSIANGTELAKQFEDALLDSGKYVTIGGCALEIPAADPAQGSHFYGVTVRLSPNAFRQLLYVIPELGWILRLADVVKDAAKDPKGTVEALRYTPEAMLDIAKHSPEIYELIKAKGFTGMAMLMVTHGDITTKQGVMAARIMKKLQTEAWRPGQPLPKGIDPNVPPEYLEWLSKQNKAQLEALYEYSEELQKEGGDVAGGDYSIPDALPSPEDIRAKITLIANGYTEFEKVQDQANKATNDQEAKVAQAKLDEQAAQLRGDIQKLIRAGARRSADGGGPAKATGKPTNKPVTVDATESYSDVSQIPAPDPAAEDRARKLFGTSGDGVVMSQPKVEYLVHKYAGLTTEQLGELLSSGSVILTTDDGAKLAIAMTEDERPFVRTLFLRTSHMKPSKADSKDKPGTPSDTDAQANDSKLVASYHAKQREAARTTARNARAGASSPGTDGAYDEAYADALDDAPAGGDGANNQTIGDKRKPTSNSRLDATTGSDASAAGAIDDNHLVRFGDFATDASWLTSWDAEHHELVLNDAAVNELLNNWHTQVHGANARITKVQLVQDDEGDDGETVKQFSITVQVTIDGAGSHIETLSGHYWPHTGQAGTYARSVGGWFLASLQQLVEAQQ